MLDKTEKKHVFLISLSSILSRSRSGEEVLPWQHLLPLLLMGWWQYVANMRRTSYQFLGRSWPPPMPKWADTASSSQPTLLQLVSNFLPLISLLLLILLESVREVSLRSDLERRGEKHLKGYLLALPI